MPLSQSLSEDGIARRYAFVREDIAGVLNIARSSTGAHVHFDCYAAHSDTRTPRGMKGLITNTFRSVAHDPILLRFQGCQ
jgi:hypothetical protein